MPKICKEMLRGIIKEDYPVECHVRCILKNIVVGMSHELDVTISGLTLGYQVHQDLLCVLAVASEGCSYLEAA